MPAARLNLVIERGADFSTVITWRDEADVLVNLTGYSGEMDVREERADTATQIATFTDGNGRITLGGAAGTITLSMTAVDTAALTAGTGWFDLLLTTGGGLVTRLVEGVVVIAERVTA